MNKNYAERYLENVESENKLKDAAVILAAIKSLEPERRMDAVAIAVRMALDTGELTP